MTEESTSTENPSNDVGEAAKEDKTASIQPSEPSAPDTYHKPETLFRIAIWSGWVAWAFLVVALLNFGLRVYNNYYPLFTSGQVDYQSLMYLLINETYTILFMVFVFLVLQGVSQGSYILMDIFEKNENA